MMIKSKTKNSHSPNGLKNIIHSADSSNNDILKDQKCSTRKISIVEKKGGGAKEKTTGREKKMEGVEEERDREREEGREGTEGKKER